ncbi:glycosyltransferase family 4 protein [Parabacteroides sp. AF48-14]|uniref:glycosyltransferase family 4 protein n=1 Tax=Parabacteroides sp. AF48-14 TaxID=2292052 RepID=UPI001313E0E4|nr:glycosyltransferase family 4 protein [Parabacteroides sp. AF48-14]
MTKEDAKDWKNIRNLYVITNAISFIPEKGSTCLNKQVISVGRLTVQKGYDMLLEAWNKVVQKHPDWQLAIYGQGEDYAKLQSIIQQYAIGDSVHIFPPTRDIADKYLNASIYVMSSRYEGFPMVLPEAMACGLPCVSFAAPCGPSEIISQGEDGFITPVGDIQALSEKLSLLMGDEPLRCRMGEKARSNIMRYSVEQVMGQWENLFNKLLNSKS